MKICPKCAAENADTAKFCNECGTALGINESEPNENARNANDTEPAPETSKEEITPEENSEPTPVAVEETVNDDQESSIEQTEKKEESSPKKKNRLIIGVVAAALICIIGFMAARPRLKSLEVTYSGDTLEGVELDNENDGFKVIAVYSDGKKEEVPKGEWKINTPTTLKADSTSGVTISYKGKNSHIDIMCTSSNPDHIEAKYKGSTEEGTIISENSDIDVTVVFKNGEKNTLTNVYWSLIPETTTLQNGITSEITVSTTDTNDNKYTAELSITGTEKPITNPKIEGDHYNFSAKQLVTYLESKYGYSFSTDDQTKIGDSYFYRVTAIDNIAIKPSYVEVRENASGKVNYYSFMSNDIMDGLNTSISLARAFGGTMNSVKKNDMSFQMFMISKMHISDDTYIECKDAKKNEGYIFYVMPYDYKETFWEEQSGN